MFHTFTPFHINTSMLLFLRDFSSRSPRHALLLMLMLMFGGASLASFIGFAIAQLFMGVPLLTDPQLADGLLTDPSLLHVVRMLQLLQAVGMMVVPSIIMLAIGNEHAQMRALFQAPARQPVLLCVALFLVLLPFINFMADLNAQVVLPGAFGEWAAAKEAQLAELTSRFLEMPHLGWLGLNLMMIGLLPALGEELLFRGVLQRNLTRWWGNAHVAVWVSAMLFSAIHMQFLGFVPRMLMGAVLGYLLVWSGNLWYPIMAHLVNNAGAVVLVYLQQHGQLGEDVGDVGIGNPVLAAFSLAFGMMLLYLFRMTGGQQSSVSRLH
jgi:uncharacterized protein